MIRDILNYLQDQFLNNDFFSGAVSATIIGSFMFQLKSIPKLIWSRIERRLTYTVTIYQSSELFEALEHYLFKNHYKKYRTVEASMAGELSYDDEEPQAITRGGGDTTEDVKAKKQKIKFSHHSDEFVVWINKRPIYISNGREKLENASSLKNAFIIHFTIRGFLGKKRINELLNQVIDSYAKTKIEKITTDVFVNDYSNWDRVKTVKKSFDNVIIPAVVKSDLLDDLKNYNEIKPTYQRMDIPYKRGYLFHGSPGNGKTSLAAAMADHLKKHICYLNLKSVAADQELQQLFSRLPSNSILILEDIDASFNGRESKGKITFSALLNCLDGIFFKEDLITIITTNHVEKLDPALIRPGRVDFKLQIENPDKECVEQYLSLYYDQHIRLDNYSEHYCMAEIMNLCIRNSVLACVDKIENKRLKMA